MAMPTKNKHAGFTIIELLVTLVIVGMLAAIAVPVYSRYLPSAKASEAPTNLQALVQYVRCYARAHPNDWYSSNLFATNITDASGWMDETIGDPVYFDYSWDANSLTFEATGGRTGGDATFNDTDWMKAQFTDNTANTVSWTANGKMADILP